jgi:hypothetical protein
VAENQVVEPINGEESIVDSMSQLETKLRDGFETILQDVLVQTAQRLRGDCNLREVDAYPGGYSGQIDVKLELYGMDYVTVEQQIQVGKKQVTDESTEVLEEKLTIEREEDLDKVRDRSGLIAPSLDLNEEGYKEARPRRYSPDSPVAPPPSRVGLTPPTDDDGNPTSGAAGILDD